MFIAAPAQDASVANQRASVVEPRHDPSSVGDTRDTNGHAACGPQSAISELPLVIASPAPDRPIRRHGTSDGPYRGDIHRGQRERDSIWRVHDRIVDAGSDLSHVIAAPAMNLSGPAARTRVYPRRGDLDRRIEALTLVARERLGTGRPTGAAVLH